MTGQKYTGNTTTEKLATEERNPWQSSQQMSVSEGETEILKGLARRGNLSHLPWLW